MRKTLAILLILTLCLASFACAEETPIKIGATCHIENQWGAMLSQGYQDACDDYGVELLLGNYNQDTAKLVELLDTYVSQGVTGIMTNPDDATTALLNSYADQGIYVGTTNLHFDDLTKTTVALAYSQFDLGASCADVALDIIKERLNGDPHIGVISVRSGSSVSDERDAGFVESIQAVYPDAKIENQAYTMKNDEGLQYATDMLTANPNLNIIFGGCEGGVVGAVQAVRNLGLQGKVFVFGVDASEQMCQMLLDDDEVLWAIGGQDSYTMAYEGMSRLIERIQGKQEYELGQKEFCEVPALDRNHPDDVKAFIEMLHKYQEG